MCLCVCVLVRLLVCQMVRLLGCVRALCLHGCYCVFGVGWVGWLFACLLVQSFVCYEFACFCLLVCLRACMVCACAYSCEGLFDCVYLVVFVFVVWCAVD